MELVQNENSDPILKKNDITEKIIGCAYTVSNSLGSGFLEKVYENALVLELEQAGLKVIQQKPIQIQYKGKLVGEYVADLLINDKVLVELKAAQSLEDVFFAQCLNYLRATGLEVCLLINFGKPELQIKRVSARPEWVKK
jgi:GxxExxY protein